MRIVKTWMQEPVTRDIPYQTYDTTDMSAYPS